MALHLTFKAVQPVVNVTRGRQTKPWENDIAPIKVAVEAGDIEPGRYVLVEKFAAGTTTNNKKAASALAGKINRRVEKVGLTGYHARMWPIPDEHGQPMLGERAPYGTWVSYDPTKASDGTTGPADDLSAGDVGSGGNGGTADPATESSSTSSTTTTAAAA